MPEIYLRDRLWNVEGETPLDGGRVFFRLRDRWNGEISEALCPPEKFERVSSSDAEFERRLLSPFALWSLRHQALRFAATETLPLAAIHAGRILPEAYQFVPAARLLDAPRPSLLIADEVGLGKTIEAGICLTELIARGRARRILLVVPPGLIPQWQDEMREKFGLAFHLIENAAALDRAQTALAEGLKPWHFLDRVITSVDYLKRREVLAGALEKPWDVIVVDEAHALAESGTPRNPYSTQRTRLGRRLRDATTTLLLLTATPHNGHRHSFRSLLELVAPTDATFAGDREVVRRRVARSMVRRLKSQIHRTDPATGLPKPSFQAREPVRALGVVTLPSQDREVFRLVSSYCSKVASAAADTDEADLVSFAMQIVKKRMLSSRAALTSTVKGRLEALTSRGEADDPPSRAELRELQTDLALGETEQERIADRVIRASVPRDARRRNDEKKKLKAILVLLEEAAPLPDAKFAALAEDLRASVLPLPGEKAIVFTEYVDTLAALRAHLESQPDFAGSLVTLTGGLGTRPRLAALARFDESGCRFLLATDAASEGLNLQRQCCRLYHLELPWNPIRLEQRNGRIDRHGQARPPKISYLYYPQSPEDRMLDRLVRRIVQMQDDKVSTPDILGLLSGDRIDRVLAEVDVEDDDSVTGQRAESLFRVFDEERATFVREMSPLLSASDPHRYAGSIADPWSADPIAADDADFAAFMTSSLGTALTPLEGGDLHALQTPPSLLGGGVLPRYEALTFRRAVAIEHPSSQVEFVHRFHPLARAVFEDAWRRVALSGLEGRSGDRLAVRRHSSARESGPYALFQFLATRHPPDGTLFSIALRTDGTLLDEPFHALAASDRQQPPGEVPWAEVEAVFGPLFAVLSATARATAEIRLAECLAETRNRREEAAVVLREDAARYRADRLGEIDREEREARQAEERIGPGAAQPLLFETRDVSGFKARRAAVETFHTRRLADLDHFVSGETEPPPLHPLGVLFVFPPS